MKFILTPELGRLCKWLIILGYDACYFKGRGESLILKALKEDRIILTRKVSIFDKYSSNSIYIKYDTLSKQFKELHEKIGLDVEGNSIFSRCVACNVEVVTVDKVSIKNRIPDYVFNTEDDFKKCPKCRKIFWPGTHWELVNKYFSKLLI